MKLTDADIREDRLATILGSVESAIAIIRRLDAEDIWEAPKWAVELCKIKSAIEVIRARGRK